MDMLAKLREVIETGVEEEKIELKRELDLSTRAGRMECVECSAITSIRQGGVLTSQLAT